MILRGTLADIAGLVCSQAAGRPAGGIAAGILHQYLELDRTPGLLVFRMRLGLTLLDLAADNDRPSADRVFPPLIGDILATADGYAAREVLVHKRGSALLNLAEQHKLTSAVQEAGFGLGAIPSPLMSDLFSAVRRSETVIEDVLAESVNGRASAY